MKKEIVESKIEALVVSWAAANAAAWDTVGRPGPCFSMGDIGDWDYIDESWRDYYASVEADVASATQAFWAALSAAPVWLRLSRPWLKSAWERAFVNAREGYYIGHHAMPDLEDIFRRMGV